VITLAESIDLHDFPAVTLNYFSTNAERLHAWCKKNDIEPGQRVIIVGRSGRVRILEYKVGGWVEVTLVEYNRLLSTQVMIFAHYERQLRGDPRLRIEACRRDLERRIVRREEMAKRRAEREKDRVKKRNGH